jgi:hypothetical protein
VNQTTFFFEWSYPSKPNNLSVRAELTQHTKRCQNLPNHRSSLSTQCRHTTLAIPVESPTPTSDISIMSWPGLLASLTARAIINPRVAVDLLRVAWRFRHRHWYRRFPFIPLPAVTYLRWRLYTAYGDEQAIPPADDVIAFARWVGQQP